MTKKLTILTAFFFILMVRCSNHDKQEESKHDNSISNTTLVSVDPKKVDDFLATKMKSLKIPGISIAVLHRGNLEYKNSYGFANLEYAVPVTSESTFKIASLTKPITAIAIIQLMEKS